MQINIDRGGIPQKAIDGSTSSFYNNFTCSLTKPVISPWWYVNLLEPYMVQLVRLDFGKSCCGKLLFPVNLQGDSKGLFITMGGDQGHITR